VNPDFRRVALIAASLGLLISLFFALRSDDDDSAAQTTNAQTVQTTTESPATTEQATTEASPATTAEPEAVCLEYVIVRGQPQGGIARDSVDRGRSVVITVTSDVADEVHVHGYDLSAEVAPGAPATIRFVADAPGRFEIELENSAVQVAELEVRP
jgi:hypothetical protein